MTACAMCGKEKKLIKAHIIPQAFHPKAQPEGDAVILPGADIDAYPKRSRTGAYDERILCAECDGKLGILDQHAAEHLLPHAARKSVSVEGIHGLVYQYPTANGATLREFIASVALRASYSTHDLFNLVRLGPYEQVLHGLVTGMEDPGSRVEAMVAEFHPEIGGYLNPHHTTVLGVNFLLIYAGRFIFYLKLDKRPMPALLHSFRLEPEQPVRSLFRRFDESIEARLMRKIIENPRFQPVRDRWNTARTASSS